LQFIDADSCHPGDVHAFKPTPYVHAAAPRDVCRPDAGGGDPGRIFESCFGPNASKAACVAQVSLNPANTECWECIETASGAGAYGPVLSDTGGFVTANVAGCVELADPTALGCAKALQAKAQCDLMACEANCPVSTDPASAGPSLAAYDECTQDVEVGGCKGFAEAGVTACESADPTALVACGATATVDGGGATFQDFFNAAVPLFCQAVAVDASAVDASAVDASVAADAGGSWSDATAAEDAHPSPYDGSAADASEASDAGGD
jgi:hypothetical protein